MVIAANTGFSAWIDGNGVVRRKGPRREPDSSLVVEARPDGRRSLYTRIGDLFSGSCLVVCLGSLGSVVWSWRRK